MKPLAYQGPGTLLLQEHMLRVLGDPPSGVPLSSDIPQFQDCAVPTPTVVQYQCR